MKDLAQLLFLASPYSDSHSLHNQALYRAMMVSEYQDDDRVMSGALGISVFGLPKPYDNKIVRKNGNPLIVQPTPTIQQSFGLFLDTCMEAMFEAGGDIDVQWCHLEAANPSSLGFPGLRDILKSCTRRRTIAAQGPSILKSQKQGYKFSILFRLREAEKSANTKACIQLPSARPVEMDFDVNGQACMVTPLAYFFLPPGTLNKTPPWVLIIDKIGQRWGCTADADGVIAKLKEGSVEMPFGGAKWLEGEYCHSVLCGLRIK